MLSCHHVSCTVNTLRHYYDKSVQASHDERRNIHPTVADHSFGRHCIADVQRSIAQTGLSEQCVLHPEYQWHLERQSFHWRYSWDACFQGQNSKVFSVECWNQSMVGSRPWSPDNNLQSGFHQQRRWHSYVIGVCKVQQLYCLVMFNMYIAGVSNIIIHDGVSALFCWWNLCRFMHGEMLKYLDRDTG